MALKHRWEVIQMSILYVEKEIMCVSKLLFAADDLGDDEPAIIVVESVLVGTSST